MIRAHHPEPCWEIVDAETHEHDDWESDEGWAHYRNRVKAAEAIAERVLDRRRDIDGPWGDDQPPLLLVAVQSFPTPCVGIFCDVCDDEFDVTDNGSTHLDPSDSAGELGLSEFDWVEIGLKHYCPDCTPPWCDDCDERHPDGECQDAKPRPIPVSDDQLVLEIPW